jgi:hypothetical protein
MTFEFDDELTLDAFAHSGMVDLMKNAVTIYGVVCIGSGKEPHFSHGGTLTLSPELAIEVAKSENIDVLAWADEEGTVPCRYLPVAMGLSVSELFALANRAASAMLSEREEGE